MLNLNDLRIFAAVAQEESISRAALRLHYVQSNVTARVRGLEDQLGVSLLHRRGRGVSLSPQGRVLLEHAERLLALAELAERSVRETDGPAGPLRLGSMETTAALRLPDILARYCQRHPGVALHVTTGTTHELLEQVLAHRLEAALVDGPVEHAELAASPVFDEELVLARAEGADVSSALLVFRRGCSYRARFEGWLREEGRLPYRIMEMGTLEGILGCVAAGLGQTLLPRPVFHGRAGIVLSPVPDHVGRVRTQLVRRADVPPCSALAALLALLSERDREPAAGRV